MRSISFEEATAVGGGMIGAPTGPNGIPLLAAGATTQRYDDGSSLTTNSSGNVVSYTDSDGASHNVFSWRGFVNGFLTGIQIAASDCANGAAVGSLAGAALGAVPGGIGVGPGSLAGGAIGCIGNTGIGIVRTATGG